MAMDSEVGICNMALSKIGVTNLISSLSENRKEAVLCNERYPDVRDALLRDHVWNFTVKFAELAADATAPVWGWTTSYTLPSDCLRVLAVSDDAIEYELVAGRKIYTDKSGGLKVKYAAKETDVTLMDATFKTALSVRLAAELALALTKDLDRADAMMKMYRETIADARYHDAAERSPQPLSSDDYLDARMYGPEAIRERSKP